MHFAACETQKFEAPLTVFAYLLLIVNYYPDCSVWTSGIAVAMGFELISLESTETCTSWLKD
jgi:hypothetical protein